MQLAKRVTIETKDRGVLMKTGSYCVYLRFKDTTIFVCGLSGVHIEEDLEWVYIAQEGDLIEFHDHFEVKD